MKKIKKKKPLSTHSRSNWPDEKTLSEIREQLSSEKVMGSTVLDTDASLTDQIKHDLCKKIVQFHLKHKLSQKELADKLNVDEPEMSRILHYKISRYSIDRLIGYLEVLYPRIHIEVTAA
jgi:predicted XRE-type DNA-binding protein